jgi:hypothetical protein
MKKKGRRKRYEEEEKQKKTKKEKIDRDGKQLERPCPAVYCSGLIVG